MLLEFCDRLHEALEDDIEERSAALADGAASSFEDYRHRVGHIKGLRRANDLLLEVKKKVLEDDNDDNDPE